MTDLPLGVSTWSFNGLSRPEVGAVVDGGAPVTCGNQSKVWAYFKELTSVILDSDIQFVELWYSPALHEGEVREQLVRLADDGRIASVHAPFGPKLDLSSPDPRIRRDGISASDMAAHLASTLGAHRIVVHGSSLPGEPEDLEAALHRSAESIREIADHAAKIGVDIAVEILVRPNLGSTVEELERLLDEIDRPNVGACIDLNHVLPQDRLAPTIERLGSRILTLHVSDYDGVTERHWIPGRGTIDWAAVVADLRKVGYEGPFLYEVRFSADGIDDMAEQIEANHARLTREPVAR